jgi:hypothetical protein
MEAFNRIRQEVEIFFSALKRVVGETIRARRLD